jgi:hypothetical protein
MTYVLEKEHGDRLRFLVFSQQVFAFRYTRKKLRFLLHMERFVCILFSKETSLLLLKCDRLS